MNQSSNPISIEEYHYLLADERIAKFPLPKRDASKLLIYKNKQLKETVFSNLVDFLPENCLLVYNNTKVIQARLLFYKETGAKIEIFCLEPSVPSGYAPSLAARESCVWKCMTGNLKKWKGGKLEKKIKVNGRPVSLTALLISSDSNVHQVLFEWDDSRICFAEILEAAGELPIPPYLNRKTEESDRTTYQTVYSKIEGSVAAPTAGLHFTDDVLSNLKTKNIRTQELTLHVGAGTFWPIKSNDIRLHRMHAETVTVQKVAIEQLLANVGNIIAVGTTSVRTLESLYFIGCQMADDRNPEKIHVSQWAPYEHTYSLTVEQSLENILRYLAVRGEDALHADTQIMIKPGYKFRITDGMITNFHQPGSTLLLLVSAFVDGNWREIYNYALTHNFRFLSYGDSSLLLK
ncbi:MAG: S-adenosylmethionine:tRNA ribosyltransferase-isomerase [Prevotellaceae bacterium]|nr:S-adenosylmethionine:tRNA ribosyltransferase-isomerase [Prevotellaceae bacterium]